MHHAGGAHASVREQERPEQGQGGVQGRDATVDLEEAPLVLAGGGAGGGDWAALQLQPQDGLQGRRWGRGAAVARGRGDEETQPQVGGVTARLPGGGGVTNTNVRLYSVHRYRIIGLHDSWRQRRSGIAQIRVTYQ